MSWVLLALQIVLSGVLLTAATGKALRAEEFLAALRLSHLPAALITPLGVGIPAVEFGLAGALLLSTPRSLRITLAATIALLAAFTAWMIWVVARQLHLECGCFGTRGVEVGLYTIVRNSLLLLIAGSALTLAWQTRSPLPPPSAWLVIAVTSVGLGCVLLRALWIVRPALILTMHELERTADRQREA